MSNEDQTKMTKVINSEAINLQANIIAWLQQQVIQPNFNLSEVKEIMDVLTEATKSYETLFNLEERRLNQIPVSPVEAPAPKKARKQRTPKEKPATPPLEEEDDPDREYFSLEQAHADAVKAGYDRSASVFRRDLTEGMEIYGWRKANRSGNKPSYYKVQS